MQYLPSTEGFLGLPEEQAVSYEQAKAVIIPFGLEKTTSYGKGTAQGPQAMIDASHQVELFDETFFCEPHLDIGIITAKPEPISENLEQALAQLSKNVSTVLNDKKFPMTFGGEHSITAGTIVPFIKKYDNLTILHFDAHADLRDSYEGEKNNHACALRRCLDYPNVELVSCGIRNISSEEIPFYEKNKHRIHIYWAKDKAHWDLKKIAAHFKGKPVYLTFDLDGFDASLMPATGTPEPGGLFWQEAIDIITEVSKVSDIVGADINELAPIKNFHACDFLAAKLAYKILALKFLKSQL